MSHNGPDAYNKTTQEVHECCARACDQALYEDELWVCADCSDLFCESHIADLLDTDGERYLGASEKGSVYLCEPCATKRARKGPAAERREYERFEGAA